MDASYKFAKFVADLKYEDIPAAIVSIVKRDIQDTIGCMLAGSSNRVVDAVLELMEDMGGAEECRTFAHGAKLPAASAAFVNGTMVFVTDYDDLCDPANLHIGAASIPVALAMAEKLGSVSGRELITAVTAGMEIACRLGIHTVRRTPGEVMGGWDYIFLLGIFSAAAITAKLLKLNEEQILNALGIAYHQAAGTSISARDKADTKIMGGGFACKAGILSALLAQKGVTGAKNIFDECPGSLAFQYNAGCDREALVAGLGEDYALQYLGFKAYPTCGNVQRHIDAVLRIMEENAIDPAEITEVVLNVAEMIYPMCIPEEITKCPPDIISAQFSIPWTSACAAARKRVTLAEFEPEALQAGDIRAMAQKITCVCDTSLEHYRVPAQVTIKTARGEFTGMTREYQTGHWANPISQEFLDAKFRDCAGYCVKPVADVDGLLGILSRLEELDNAMTLVEALP